MKDTGFRCFMSFICGTALNEAGHAVDEGRAGSTFFFMVIVMLFAWLATFPRSKGD